MQWEGCAALAHLLPRRGGQREGESAAVPKRACLLSKHPRSPRCRSVPGLAGLTLVTASLNQLPQNSACCQGEAEPASLQDRDLQVGGTGTDASGDCYALGVLIFSSQSG